MCGLEEASIIHKVSKGNKMSTWVILMKNGGVGIPDTRGIIVVC